jgi:alpha-L-fucosidase
VGRGAQLVLGLAPDNRGLMPEVDVARLGEFGRALGEIYGHNLCRHGVAPQGFEAATDGDPDTFWSAPAGARAAAIQVAFEKPVAFDRAVSMEWLAEGQHVQKYTVEAGDGKAWQTLYTGTTIGHRKIDIFPRTTARQVRLRILSAAGEIRIREFQIFDGKGR